MIDMKHVECVDQGERCIPIIVDFVGEKRLVGFLHYRVAIVMDHYKDAEQSASQGDMMLADAGIPSTFAKFRVSIDDKELMPLWIAPEEKL